MLRLFNRSEQSSKPKTGAERRSLPRARASRAAAIVDGENLQLVNWNVNGFLASKYHGRHGAGNRVTARVIIPGKSGILSFGGDGEVVRVSRRDGYIAVRFIDIDKLTRDKVQRYVAKNRDTLKWDMPK